MPVRRLTTILTMIVASALAGGGFAQTPARSASLPPFDHLFLIVLENRGYDQVLGNPAMPAINALAHRYALAGDDHGVAHPSLPNYVALISGGTWGSHSDDPSQTFDHPTLAGQLEAAGLTWKAYMQGLPSPGFEGDFAGSGGLYAKKHDPFLLFPRIAGDPARAKRVVPLGQLGADLETGNVPTFAFIVPDQCHDMHGTSTCSGRAALDRAGDAFVDRWVHAIQASSAWTGHSAIVITFDEAPEGIGSLLGAGGNHIATIVIARQGPRGLTSHVATNHYSLLRTLEGAWGLPYLGRAATASSMDALFR